MRKKATEKINVGASVYRPKSDNMDLLLSDIRNEAD
jgi:hypothetical protein